MRKHMKKHIVLFGICIWGLGVVACGSNDEMTNEPQNVTMETVDKSITETIEGEEINQVEETTEVSETQIDVEEESILVDERYECKLYDANDIKPSKEDNGTVTPIIGFNIPEGWSNAGGGSSTISNHTGIEYQTAVNISDGITGVVNIWTNEEMYEWTFEKNIYDLAGEIVERTETGRVETPFGTAVIYSIKYEIDGNQYDAQTVLLTVGTCNVTMNSAYATVDFEELLPQMFELE